MTVDQYFRALRGKRILVLGLGVSNRPLVRLLLGYGIAVTACDKTPREQLDAELLELERQGCRLKLGADYLEDLHADVAFRTPGLHPDRPELARLRQEGCRITSEMEAFFEVCPCQIIGVTGSDGKTTTTTLISEMLKKEGYTVWLGGNIGTPLLDKVKNMRPEDRVVLELSSFQLLHMPYSPHIAVITNLAPNHLDMHRDMDEYVAAKENIYLHQGKDDVLIVNMDNAITNSFCSRARGEVRKFSRRAVPERGVYLRDGMIYRKDRTEQALLPASSILLPGLHNAENYMAAICALGDLVHVDTIRYVAEHFGGVEHRIELVREYKGVRYYNDSIASSPSRTIAGLRSFPQKVILIAGGYDKHLSYDTLGEEIVQRVKLLICTGATGEKIRDATVRAAKGGPCPPILMIDDFYEAIRTAAGRAEASDVVLLSPASAAFDKFKNFMVRGQEFKKTVQAL